jgi:hypothetical protein
MDMQEKKGLDPKAKRLDPKSSNAIGEHPVDPAEHDAYWRANYAKRPYVEPGAPYDDYAPAYRYGVETVRRYEDKSFDEAEAELREEWVRARGASKLDWDQAKHPVRDAWDWVKTDIDHD